MSAIRPRVEAKELCKFKVQNGKKLGSAAQHDVELLKEDRVQICNVPKRLDEDVCLHQLETLSHCKIHHDMWVWSAT